jgi:hypothetical protein
MSSSEWETMTESTVSSNAPMSTSTTSSVSYALSGLSPLTSYASSELATPIDTRIQRTKDTMSTETNVVFDAECVKKRANWSKVKKEHNLVDYPGDPNVLLADIETHSPKLDVLLRKIKSLDESDMREHGTKFKHMIFTALKSNSYGVKIIASALIANGMTLGYTAAATDSGKKKFKKIQMLTDSELQKTKGPNLYVLSSVSVFDQPISVPIKKDILARFNARPENIHGDNVRFIVMDSGFKEGIDIFDIKYVHIFEPQSTAADQKQVIGRGTRTCGQKGLQFQPNVGWPLHVFVYDIIIPNELKGLMGNVDTTFQLYMKSLNLDLRLFSFTGELERATIQGSVDYDLNENIHNAGAAPPTGDRVPRNPPAGGGTGYVYGELTNGGRAGGEAPAGGGTGYVYGELTNGGRAGGEAPAGGMEGGVRGARAPVVNVRDVSPIVVMPNDRMSYDDLRKRIIEHFGQYKWDKVKMENLCKGDDVPPNPPTPEVTGGYVYNQGMAGGVRGVKPPQGGAPAVITLTPTQNFLKHYFIPSNPIKGMLLWHSTGSGKTCSAIAAASNEFEKEGYTILWVTRTTLKNDIWKNMFDQVCHEVIRTKLSSGEIAMPSVQPKRMKLLSQSWRIRPMSYKQFSNLVSKQNQLYDSLVKINGPADPLRKTLIIIDEAHKLYGSGDLSSIERPDMKALQASLLNSYAVSGRDSVRLLLMTATPITTNPLEMIQLLNLCKPIGEQIPTDFDDFSTRYLSEDTGKFSALGMKLYLDDIAGHVSYLNREKDARQFSQPVLHQIRVPLVKMSDVNTFDKRAVRELVNSDILKLKDKIEANNEELIGELNDLDVNKFKVLRKECDSFSFKTTCNKIAQKNMRKIVQEARDEVKRIKAQIKNARESIRMHKFSKKENINKIIAKIEASPDDYEKFKQGAYYNLKTKCGKTIRTESELLKEHPDLEPFIRVDQAQTQKIQEMEDMLKISEDGFKNRIKELKLMLKTDLRDIERSVVKLVIKDTQKDAAKIKRLNLKTFGEQVILVNKTRKSIGKQRKKRIGSLTRDLKEQLRDEKMEKKEIEKGEKALRKQLRKQEDYTDDIKHGMLTGLIDKYKGIMREQLTEEREKESRKAIEKQTRKLQKEMERDNKKQTKKMQKELDKENKKLQKETERENNKQTKKQQKESEKQTKKLQRDNKTKK